MTGVQTCALPICNIEKYPNDYAKLSYDLALVYGGLASFQDKEQNAMASLKFSQEALKVWTPDKNPLDYARTQLTMGHGFLLMAKSLGVQKARADALEAYSQAAEIYKKENLPRGYQMVLKLMRGLEKDTATGESLSLPTLPGMNTGPRTPL